MKKMNSKEFKEVLEKAGFPFEIWGYEGILNILSDYERMYSKYAYKKGFVRASEGSARKADIIYNELDKIGYYDDCKHI